MISALPMMGQEAAAGFHLPVQISTNVLFSERFDTRLPSSLANLPNSRSNSLEGVGAGVRLLAAPTLKFNENWFAHATFSLNTQPFFPYEAYHVDRARAQGRLIQGYLGYTRNGQKQSLTLKAGQMASVFGDFARRYTDTANPLIDAPQPYGSYLLLRPDELPCSNFDLQHQQRVHPNISAYHCAPWESYSYGILPVTPYGLFGAELDWNYQRFDLRLQLTNSNPSNPQSPLSKDQSLQWAMGAGVSLWNGLRVGFSMFQGPWLSGKAAQEVRACCRGKRHCACAKGIDVQYARGRYSFKGEWMRFQYHYPHFQHSPAVQYGYVESKVILNPRLYLASRIGSQRHNSVSVTGHPDLPTHTVVDSFTDPSISPFQPNKTAVEVALGFRPTRHHLLKVGHQWVGRSQNYGPRDHVFMVQLVASLPEIWKSF